MDKIFHDLEYVPLFGDMQISPFNYVKKTKNFDASKWPLAVAASSSNFSSSNQSPQANLQVRGTIESFFVVQNRLASFSLKIGIESWSKM